MSTFRTDAGNPNLQPERTKNYNIGFELSPTRNNDIGFDWYKIDITNVIGVEPLQPRLDRSEQPGERGA